MSDSLQPHGLYSLPGSSVYGIIQARILEWVAMPSPWDLPNSGIKPMFLMSPVLAGGFFTTSTTWEAKEWSELKWIEVKWKSFICVQLFATLWTDFSPPGSSVRGISQARILEWVAILFSRGSSLPRDQTQVSCIAGRFFTIWATSALSAFWLTRFQTTNSCHEFFTLFIPVPTECTLNPNQVPVGIIASSPFSHWEVAKVKWGGAGNMGVTLEWGL